MDNTRFQMVSSSERPSLEFNKMRVDNNTFRDDVVLKVNDTKQQGRARKAKRADIERAIERQDIAALRVLSNEFFLRSGIYSRLCRYVAYLYRYDWFVIPIINSDKVNEDKVIDNWFKACTILDNSRLKRNFGEIALKVVRNGCYYAYRIQQKEAEYLQELPLAYCRSRYRLNGKNIVEFNVKYFDDCFRDAEYRVRVLKMFPKEFQQGYIKYKKGALDKDFNGDQTGWISLDPEKTIKFNLNNSDVPLFVSIIPKIMDLEDAQELDKKRMEQQLIRLIIQQMPINKDGVIIFDVEEARELHRNAVQMVGEAVGVDVLTTFADVKVEDLSDKSNMSAADQLDKVERTVYNEAGVSQMQFNTSGNLALEKSIANDEATMTDLLLQFEEYAESILYSFNRTPKKCYYKVQMLPTTIYNYKELSKMYKEQTQIGFSKLLPQVALGQSQSMVLATAVFENEMMHLGDLFIPPQMSSTMSGKAASGDTEASGGSKGGRPELPDDQKSEKTIINRESAS